MEDDRDDDYSIEVFKSRFRDANRHWNEWEFQAYFNDAETDGEDERPGASGVDKIP